MHNIVHLENYRRRKQAPKRSRLMIRISNRLLLWVLTSQFLEDVWKPVIVAVCAAGTSYFLLTMREHWGFLISLALAALSIWRTFSICADHWWLYFRTKGVRNQSDDSEDDPLPPHAA